MAASTLAVSTPASSPKSKSPIEIFAVNCSACTAVSYTHLIDQEPTYGYAIATTLRDSGFADLTEGTLYPLLLRLERKGLIAAEYRAGSGGPSRKYYRLTPDGVQYLNEFTEAWQNASDTVNRILHDKEG